jgi:hypothetical protein
MAAIPSRARNSPYRLKHTPIGALAWRCEGWRPPILRHRPTIPHAPGSGIPKTLLGAGKRRSVRRTLYDREVKSVYLTILSGID